MTERETFVYLNLCFMFEFTDHLLLSLTIVSIMSGQENGCLVWGAVGERNIICVC